MQFFICQLRVPAGREAETRLLDFRIIGALAPKCLLGLLLPTCARLTTRRTYSFGMTHFWDAYVPATLGRTFVALPNLTNHVKLERNLKSLCPQWDQNNSPAKAGPFCPKIGHN